MATFVFKTASEWGRRQLAKPWLSAVALVLTWRLALWLVGISAFAHILHPFESLQGPVSPLWEMWARFDASWYVKIAEHGYTGTDPIAAVFFPLFPLLIRLGSQLADLHPIIVAVSLATLCTALAIVQFQRLLAFDYHQAIQQRAIWYLLLSPMAVFLAAGYSEALFLLLMLSAFVAARQGRWAGAAGFAALASATRLVGVVVGIVLVIEYLEQRQWRWSAVRADILWLLAAPAGLLAYMAWLNFRFGDPLRFLHAYQDSQWPRTPFSLAAFGPFLGTASDMVNVGLLRTDLPRFVAAYHEAFLPVASLILGVVVLIKVRRSYGVLVLGLLAIPMLSGDASSLNRFTLPLFPIYIALALAGWRPLIHWGITVFSALLLALSVIKFVNGYFVA